MCVWRSLPHLTLPYQASAVRAAFAAQPDEPVPAGLVLAAGRTFLDLSETLPRRFLDLS